MRAMIDEEDVQKAIMQLDGIKDTAINHANPYDPTMEEWEPVYDGADDVSDLLNQALAQVERQKRCPYCHFDHNENTELIPIVNGYLSIDPESSKLIDRENWDYRDDGPSDYSESHHINYCYMCGRRLDGDD